MRRTARFGSILLPAALLAVGAAWADETKPPPVAAARPAAVPDVVKAVDDAMLDAWTGEGRTPGPAASDAVLLRRTTLDLAGRLPTADEVRAYLADAAPDKRARAVDRLLDDTTAAVYFGEWYARLLLGRDDVRVEHRRALEDWLAEAWRERVPYDRLVGELVSARGEIPENGAAAYCYQLADQPPALAGRTARLFLGVEIACAECHDHPFDRWKQSDFQGFAAFFRAVGREKVPTPVDQANALLGRANRAEAQAVAEATKAKKDLEAARDASRKAAVATRTADEALRPLAAAAAKVRGPAGDAAQREKAMQDLAARAEKLAGEAEARAKDAAKPLLGLLGEQAKVARETAGLARDEAKAAAGASAAWAKRLGEAEAKAKPLADRWAAAKRSEAQLSTRVDELQGLATSWDAAVAAAKEVVQAAHDLASQMPDVYRDTYVSEGKPVPPDVFRVVDRGGKVGPHPDTEHPEKGDGLPKPLEGDEIAAGADLASLRDTLARWMLRHEDPWLARALVNRMAERLLGRPFVDPVDALTGPGERFAEPALDRLADGFRASGYDLRWLVRVLALTRAYALASAAPPRARPAGDAPGTAQVAAQDAEDGAGPPGGQVVTAPVRELEPTVALRAVVEAALPGLPDALLGGPRAQREAWLRAYGMHFDDGRDHPETEPRGGIARALWMWNGAPAGEALRGRPEGLATRLVAADLPTKGAVEAVYLAFLSRPPTAAEAKVAEQALPTRPGDEKQVPAWKKARTEAIEDLEWALMNGDEFLFER